MGSSSLIICGLPLVFGYGFFMWIYFPVARCIHPHQSKVINIACMIPVDDRYLFSMRRMAPAISIAVDRVAQRSLIPSTMHLKVRYASSNCSSAESINEAIKYYMNIRVHLFLGPCCDYAVAPVARQVWYWNIPIVSPGAMARDLASKIVGEYPLLTRMGPNINSLATFFFRLLKFYGWKKVKILYKPEGQRNIGERFCHVAADGIHHELQGLGSPLGNMNFTASYYKFYTIEDILTILSEEIGVNFGEEKSKELKSRFLLKAVWRSLGSESDLANPALFRWILTKADRC